MNTIESMVVQKKVVKETRKVLVLTVEQGDISCLDKGDLFFLLPASKEDIKNISSYQLYLATGKPKKIEPRNEDEQDIFIVNHSVSAKEVLLEVKGPKTKTLPRFNLFAEIKKRIKEMYLR